LKKESGFIKQIIIIIVLGLLVIFGYFVYQSIQKNHLTLSVDGIKSLISGSAADMQNAGETAKQKAIDDAKNQAADSLKGQVDKVLGTE
jgi:hypothetical protein